MKNLAEILTAINNANKRWLTVEDFEDEFKIGENGQEAWRKNGTLPFSKIGKRIYYDRFLVDKVFEEHTVNKALV